MDHNNNGWFSHNYSNELDSTLDDDDEDSIIVVDDFKEDDPTVVVYHDDTSFKLQNKPRRVRRKQRQILGEKLNENRLSSVTPPESYLIDRYKYAVRHIRQGLSVEEACNKYRVSRSALERCLSGGQAPRGKKTRMNESEENELVEWLIDHKDLKYNEAIHRVFELVPNMFRRLNKPNPFHHNGGKPSMDWWYDFLARHPQVMASKPDWLRRGKVNDQYIRDVQSGKLRCTKFRRALLSAIQYIRSLNDAATLDAVMMNEHPPRSEITQPDDESAIIEEEDDLDSVSLNDLIMDDQENETNSDLERASESIIDDLDQLVTSLVGQLDQDVSMFYNQSCMTSESHSHSYLTKSDLYNPVSSTKSMSNSRLLVQDDDDDIMLENEAAYHNRFLNHDEQDEENYESDPEEDEPSREEMLTHMTTLHEYI